MAEESYAGATWIFLRLLGLIYFAAFVSLAVQIRGLIGSRGILPVAEARPPTPLALGTILRAPTLCLWSASDRTLAAHCWAGAAAAVLLVAGVCPLPALLALWILYLSVSNAAGIFLGYQWDALLLEMGVIGVLLAPPWLVEALPASYDPPALARALAVWLLFRLVFSSGIAKLRSGDPSWRDLTALCHHYETQPLPNRLAWHAHRLPRPVHRLTTAAVLAVEIGAPMLLLAPAPASYVGAAMIVALMALIQATGSYCFFNLQAAALCVLVVDDATIRLLVGGGLPIATIPSGAPAAWLAVVGVCGAGLLILSAVTLARTIAGDRVLPSRLRGVLRALAPFRVANSYGLFAVMTTSRPEIVIEGSPDGLAWREYPLPFKPGDPLRAPRTAAPHQPRLDWQLWFAALGTLEANPWVVSLLSRLLDGSPDVLALFARDPFAGEPPKYVRAVLYDYRFTSARERRATGAWWSREELGSYCPPLARDPG